MNATPTTRTLPARWTVPSIQLGESPEHEMMREDLCADVYHATHVAVAHGTVIAKTPLGLCVMRVQDRDGSKLVWFDHSSDNGWTRRIFWYNASSMDGLGQILRRLPRVPFEALATGATTAPRPHRAGWDDLEEHHAAVAFGREEDARWDYEQAMADQD